MARQTSFRFTAVADPRLAAAFARHAGAARFAYNQGLRMVKEALDARRGGASVKVPWSGFDLINGFNAWKRSERAGRRWVVDGAGAAVLADVGLPWRGEVCQQVFEEALVDLGRGLAGFARTRTGTRTGRRVRFPRFKRKGRARESFRLRNKAASSGGSSVRVGTPENPRVIVLPGIGPVPVVEDTRRLRRLLRPGPQGTPRGRVWFATITAHRGRWMITLNVQAPALHPGLRHQPDGGTTEAAARFVGVDLGLRTAVVAATADATELARIPPPEALARMLPKLRRANRAASRKQPGSANRAKANRRLARLHGRVADQRRHFLHTLSSQLVKTHHQLCIEDLAVANLIRNRHLARGIGDAAWGRLHQHLRYKADWYGTHLVVVAPRWFPSSKTCSGCGRHQPELRLADRTFRCHQAGGGCGLVIDRDRNAAANLAIWAETHHHQQPADGGGDVQIPDLQAAGRVTNACRGTSAGHHPGDGETGPATPPHPGGKKQEPHRPPTR